MTTQLDQIGYPCVVMRGGTSKALFFHEDDVPPDGPERDRMLKRAIGTPDVLQIDGMGGSRLVTSKLALIKRSTRPDADVDYTFAQADVERDLIGYAGNCGNISAAVGPFAIDEGLVPITEPVTTVRIYNTNTQKMLVAKVQVAGGKSKVNGDCAIAGVPGTGAEILMDYARTVGAVTGQLLPTGNVTDSIMLESGKAVEVTICDVANPCVFFSAKNVGMTGSELPPAISADSSLIEIVTELQAKAGQLIGLWPDWKQQKILGLPLAVVVAPPDDFVDVNGETRKNESMDLRARLMFLAKCHDSMAGTGSICTSAASRVRGSVVHQVVGATQATTSILRIGHPLGILEVKVIADAPTDPKDTKFAELSFVRTARRLMAGHVFVPREHAQR